MSNMINTNELSARLVIDVTYESNGVPHEHLIAKLEDIGSHVAGEGMFTGSTDADVVTWQCSASIVAPADFGGCTATSNQGAESGPLAAAIAALAAAKDCGGEFDVEVYREAHRGLTDLLARICRLDAKMNVPDRERAPTGDDYNSLMCLLGANAALPG